MEIHIDLNEPQILEKVTGDEFGMFVSNEWKKLIDSYTPKDTGLLMQNVELRPWEIEYREPYSHYMYSGELYVDPLYGVGGFFSSDFGFWSRPGVKKVPSGKSLSYQKNNPYSTDHWDAAAEKAGQKDTLYRTLNDALQNGKF